MIELYQDTLVDLLLPKHAKRQKLEVKKDAKVCFFSFMFLILFSAFEKGWKGKLHIFMFIILFSAVEIDAINMAFKIETEVSLSSFFPGVSCRRKCNCAHYHY